MPFYFDHNATTPTAPEVLAVLAEVQAEVFGNPSSIHTFGQEARLRVEAARRQVAGLLGCQPKEIVFTSGGTEADNLAVLGAPNGHVITSAVEHPAVLASCEVRGNCTVLPVDSDGLVSPESLRAALRPDTALISVMHANNETGAVQPIAELAAIAREHGVPFHSDGVQAAGKLPAGMTELAVDLYSISAHKLGAPKGIGALFVREGVQLLQRQFGGRHERGRRPGTENVAGIAALGAACHWYGQNGSAESGRLRALRDRLEQGIAARIPGIHINAAGANRTPNTSNISFQGIEAEALVIALDLAGFAVSTGAACSSGAVEPSHVLTAMGLSPAQARSSIRFSLGRTNSAEQVDSLIAAVDASVARLRKLSPEWTHA